MHNAEDPYWNEVLDLGYHHSGDEISIKVYDADSGLEVSELRFIYWFNNVLLRSNARF